MDQTQPFRHSLTLKGKSVYCERCLKKITFVQLEKDEWLFLLFRSVYSQCPAVLFRGVPVSFSPVWD